jgi:cis-3-alkyl-4-acyloxetan-2-one decarboxylase
MNVGFERAAPLPSWIRKRFPFERRAARIDGERMTFVDHGPKSAPAVVMVHGNPTWSFLWRKVIGRLDDGSFRLIAPDLLGFGTSDKPRDPKAHRLETHVDRVTRLVEALELKSFIAVGQDWGGPVVAGVAERLRDRVRGLVFGNTAVLPPARPFRPTAFHRFSHAPVISDLVFRGTMFPVWLMHRTQGDPKSIGPKVMAAYAWPFLKLRDRAGPIGLARMVPDREDHPTTAAMDRIGGFVTSWRGPAALVWGRRDPLLGRSLKRHRAAMESASALETEAGHFLQEEVPELLSDAIRSVRG